MSTFVPPTYRTKNWPEYNKALKQRGSLTIWFNPEITRKAEPTGKRGRQPRYSNAAIQACLTLKVLFGMPLRQATGFVESLLKLVDLDWQVPNFGTLCRRQKTLPVTIPYHRSKGPLHLLIDITGIKVEGEGEWNARKPLSHMQACVAGQRAAPNAAYGVRYTSTARQANGTFAERGIEVTGNNIGDAPILPDLLGQIGLDQEIGILESTPKRGAIAFWW